MLTALLLGLTTAAVAQVDQSTPVAPTLPAPEERRRFQRSSGGEEAIRTPPDLSADFDPFAPDDTPPPRAPRFDPRRPSLAAETDPLAALIRNGPDGAVLAPSQSPEPWMLPGTRRAPMLADPPSGSAPATRVATPRAPAG